MPTLIITIDQECCRCSNKIQKILCCIQVLPCSLARPITYYVFMHGTERGEFVIEKVVYEKDKVLVSGPFDANKLSCKLCCKAGKIIKNIEVAKPPPPPPEKPKSPKKELVQCKVIYPCPYPYPCPQQPWPCSCPTCQPPPPPKPEPKPESKPKPKPEPALCNKVVYPYPYPYPYPWPCSCPTPYCECPSSKPTPTPPPAPPKQPPACPCPAWSPRYCGGYPPYMAPPPPMMPYPMVVCDDNPAYGACTVM
ncbi:hypothetical protein HU200_027089 [Digitaria exilis]|uniref:Uncharacterized protein n=1 Tax=Digitaria exilis TaxID=1010633 RepID=A0A835BWQ9_9POAL|nr:hypothetical protein HU200_027089 [Digitaria exilis]